MSNVAATSDETVVQVDGWEILAGDEPRVRDAELAARVGMAEPRKVRRVIAKHRTELEAHGAIDMRARRARISKPNGGFELRTISECWLNEPQAMALVAHLRTPKALELRIALVKVFVAVRRGQLPGAPSPVALPPSPDTDASRAMAALSEAYQAAQRAQVEHTSARWGVAFGALTRLLSDVEGLLTQTGTEEAIWALSDAANAVSGQVRHAKSRRAHRAPDSPNAQPALPGVFSPSDHSRFFAARCVLSPEARTPVKALRLAYHAWCEAEGLVPLGPRFFGRFVRERGCRSTTVRDARHQVVEGFAGVRLA